MVVVCVCLQLLLVARCLVVSICCLLGRQVVVFMVCFVGVLFSLYLCCWWLLLGFLVCLFACYVWRLQFVVLLIALLIASACSFCLECGLFKLVFGLLLIVWFGCYCCFECGLICQALIVVGWCLGCCQFVVLDWCLLLVLVV